MLLSYVIASIFLLALGEAAISVCPFNLTGKYYIVYGISTKSIGQTLAGIPNNLTESVCSMSGLRVANITADDVPGILDIWQQCSNNIAQLGLWLDYYEGLPVALDCNFLDDTGSVISSSSTCANGLFPVLCELVADVDETTTLTTTTTITFTTGGTSDALEIITSITTITAVAFTQIVTTEYKTLTNITSTTSTVTSCNSVIPTCCPNHNEYHFHIHNHYHNYVCCGKKANLLKSIDVKARKPKQTSFYRECDFSSNDYHLVNLTQLKNLQSQNINGNEACQTFGYTLANITAGVQTLISTLLQACNLSEAVFNGYYNYVPLCGIVGTDALVLDDQNLTQCEGATVALCKDGPNSGVASVVPTGPFVSNTETEIVTMLESTTTISFIFGTLTEFQYSTVTSTLFSPLILTTSLTVTTATLTRTILTTVDCTPSR